VTNPVALASRAAAAGRAAGWIADLDRASEQGLDGFLAEGLPKLAQRPVPLVVDVKGGAAGEVARVVERAGERPEGHGRRSSVFTAPT
jgi:hypothetical protein